MILSRLLRSSLKTLGIVDSASEPEPYQYEDALEALNMMLKTWSTQGLIVHHIVTETFPLMVGDASYTIGTGGDFNTVRPNRIVGGFIRDSSSADSVLQIIARDDYNDITVKNLGSRPCELYYYPTYPLAVITFDCEPDDTYTLSIDSLKPLAELSVLDADINLPPEYEEAIKYNLAVRLAPDYSITPRPDVVALASSTFLSLSVQPVPEAKFDGIPGTQHGRFNINSGY